MPERTDKLKAAITELEREIDQIDSLDPESRDLLQDVLAEILTALHKGDEALEQESVGDRLRDALHRFETAHPTLTGVLARVTDALAQIGI